ncbi:MAG: hypothetical protein J3R72DRAFT_454906 [Linnemannia gamsii]|nr:MAG: hypothetical protein J3R72DRAFT_454906 [Linnemannia gamsii]
MTRSVVSFLLRVLFVSHAQAFYCCSSPTNRTLSMRLSTPFFLLLDVHGTHRSHHPYTFAHRHACRYADGRGVHCQQLSHFTHLCYVINCSFLSFLFISFHFRHCQRGSAALSP